MSPSGRNFDLQKTARAIPRETANSLNNIGGILAKDMRDGVLNGVDINGKRIKPLKPRTIAVKKARGAPLPKTALVETTQMIGTGDPKLVKRGIHVSIHASVSSLKAVVTIVRNRLEIAAAHMKDRPFFGISRRVNKPIDDELKKLGAKIVRSGR